MRRKRWLSLLMCAALAFAVLPALPTATALAADVELEVLHSASGNLAAEIADALGGGDEAPYTKLRIIIGSAELSGRYDSGDWKTLYGMSNILPNVTSLELVYMAGDNAIPDYALYDQSSNKGASWLKTLAFVTAGSQLTGIGDYAFSHCTALKTLSLPTAVSVIGERAFSNCWRLDGTLTIPSSVTGIGDYAFYCCNGLDTLTLPAAGSLSSIGDSAFYQCTGLAGTLVIPSSVTNIGGNAFYGCTGLYALSLPATGSLNNIGGHAFDGCSGLDGTLTIPSSVTGIGDYAFYYCRGLDTLTLPAAGSLSDIGGSAFYHCTGLTGTLMIPSSVTNIAGYAFYGCTGLTALSLPETGSISIGAGAFTSCLRIVNTVYIPPSVTEIGDGAFHNTMLGSLVFQNTVSAPDMSSGSITDSDRIIAYYPASAESSYTAQSGMPIDRVPYDENTVRIISFCVNGVGGTIDETAKTITLDLPAGTDLSTLTPDIQFFGASVSPASGAVQDFSSWSVDYTVTPASGSPVTYNVFILGRPVVTGDNELSALGGSVGDQTVTATVSGSYPENIALKASISGKADISSRMGDGAVTFNFPASLINDLAVGSYSINVTAEATAHNAAVASTQIGTLTVTPPVPAIESAVSTANSVTINWGAVSGVDGYELYLYDPDAKTYTYIIRTFTHTSYLYGGHTPGTTYYYAVRSYKEKAYGKVYSDYSDVVSVTTLMATPWIKSVTTDSNSVTLEWNAIDRADGYEVYLYDPDTSTYSDKIATTTATSSTINGLVVGNTYYYALRAYMSIDGGEPIYSAYSTRVSVTPILAIPTLTAKAAGYNSIKLTWTPVSGAEGYKICRYTPETGAYTYFYSNATSYTNTVLTTGLKYGYKVLAYRNTGTSRTSYGSYSSLTYAKPIPSTPTLYASSTGYNSVRLRWTKVTGATGYRLYRATSKTGTYSLVKTTSATSYTNTGRTTGKYYYYKVRAYRTAGSTTTYGNYSSVKSAKPVPSKPSSVKAARSSSKSIKVTWGSVSGATKYQVYRSTSKTGTYSLKATTSGRSYTNTGLTTGKYYYYKVRAYHLEGSTKVYGSFSTVVYAKP